MGEQRPCTEHRAFRGDLMYREKMVAEFPILNKNIYIREIKYLFDMCANDISGSKLFYLNKIVAFMKD